ncbi:protein kinase [Actinomyces radicidentis]|uniref:serine/threonine-protein kinase n=1 Tax=Actinomyces radicidentis TaxID=111015 RepID=UPI0028EC4161|nr:protein kinase [Actinomyces radicidentis]
MTQTPGQRPAVPASLAGLRAGTVVGGYRLLRRLGAGGMGVVWEAEDADGRRVAMKILHPQIAADPVARRRLDREARVLARVRDARVARILDIETGDGADGAGVTFVITELVDGPTLQHEVDHEGAYDLVTDARDLADLAHGLVDALRAVHAAGVIHRDLKPSNVMLGAQGPVLIDFGIAQVADDTRLTQTGQVTGTPGFIPPEMLDGEEPTADVDWYACAGVLLFAVTGRAPFGTGPWQAVFRRVYAGTPETAGLETECPALARAFTAALAPDLADRLGVPDLLTVLDDIAAGGDGTDVVDELLGPDPDDVDESGTATGSYTAPYGSYGSGASAPSAGSGAYGSSAGSAASAAPGTDGYGTTGGSWSDPWTGSQGSGSGLPDGAVPPAFAPHRAQAPQVPQPSQQTGVPQPPAAWAPTSPGTGAIQPAAGYQGATGAVGPQQGAAAAVSQPLPAGPGAGRPGLPDWALEPRRHPGVVAALALALSALGAWLPAWVAIVATIAIVLAGTVGRADDARRWHRLQQGRRSRGDDSRMWAAAPWYLLRSLVATAFAVVVSLLITVAVFYVGAKVLGFGSTPARVAANLSEYHRIAGFLAGLTAIYLGVTWFIPWGAPTRRGGAKLVGLIAPSRAVRLVLSLVLLGVTGVIVLLVMAGRFPPATLEPFYSWG